MNDLSWWQIAGLFFLVIYTIGQLIDGSEKRLSKKIDSLKNQIDGLQDELESGR